MAVRGGPRARGGGAARAGAGVRGDDRGHRRRRGRRRSGGQVRLGCFPGRSGPALRDWHSGKPEQLRGVGLHVQHGRDPFQGAGTPQDPDPAAAHGLIHGPPVRDGGVETTREPDRGSISNAELHGRHRTDTALHQCGRRAGEQVAHPGLPRRAGVQDDQPGSGLGLAEQIPEPASLDQVRAPVRPDQGEDTFLADDVVVAVPDKMQNVPRVAEHLLMDAFPADVRGPGQVHQPGGAGLSQGLFQALPLRGDVQNGQAPGGGNQAQDPQRRAHLQRLGGVRRVHMTDQRL